MKKFALLLIIISFYSPAVSAQDEDYEYYDSYGQIDLEHQKYKMLNAYPFCLDESISISLSSKDIPRNMHGSAVVFLQVNKEGAIKDFAVCELFLHSYFENEVAVDFIVPQNTVSYMADRVEDVSEYLRQKDSLPSYVKVFYKTIKEAVDSIKVYPNNKRKIKDDNYLAAKIYINEPSIPLIYETYTAPEIPYAPTKYYFDDARLFTSNASNPPEYQIVEDPFILSENIIAPITINAIPPGMKGEAAVHMQVNSECQVIDFTISSITITNESHDLKIRYENKNLKEMINDGIPIKPEDLPLYLREYYEPLCNAVKALKVIRNGDMEYNGNFILGALLNIKGGGN